MTIFGGISACQAAGSTVAPPLVLTLVARTGLTASFHTLRDASARVLFAQGGGLPALPGVVAIVVVPDSRPGRYGVAAFGIAAVIYSPFYARHRRLADSPQERPALGATVANQPGGDP